MSKLITIAIPTFRRAGALDAQLSWLFRSMAGIAHDCDVILSDNASPDDTPQVCCRWQQEFEQAGAGFRINRNDQNVGPLPNIARCIEMAQSRFVWVIGDDDEIDDGTLGRVVEWLRQDPDLASILMNFRGAGKTVYPRCFHFTSDQRGDGRPIIEDCLRQAYFGLAFMSAHVYRTEFAQAALKAWPRGKSNYDYQIFITAYTGSKGRVLATRDTHVTYVTGDNVYEKNKHVGLILFADSLEVFLHLRQIGFSRRVCRVLAGQHMWRLKKRFLKRALQNNPVLTIATASRAASYLAWLVLPVA